MFTIIAFLAVALTLIAGLWTLVFVFEWPGGMRSGYRPSEHDRRLTSIAVEAIPIIQAINRYYEAHGRCPTGPDLAELHESFPGFVGIPVGSPAGEVEFRRSKSIVGWLYFADQPTVCGLWRKLGWDPSLIWQRSGHWTQWIFDPGDGSKQIEVTLDLP